MKYLLLISILFFGVIGPPKSKLWECNRCRQQHISVNYPPVMKCPATKFKSNHWWSERK